MQQLQDQPHLPQHRSLQSDAPSTTTTTTAPRTYPACPFTGRPPIAPVVPPRRCLDASAASCCLDCHEAMGAVAALAADPAALLAVAAPSVADFEGRGGGTGGWFESESAMGGWRAHRSLRASGSQMCSLFAGFHECSNALEQMTCAINCNPDSGSYVSASPHRPAKFRVCRSFARHAFAACRDMPVPGFGTLSDLLPHSDVMLPLLFGPVLKQMGHRNVSMAIVPDGSSCFLGPKLVPPTPLCCDPLSSLTDACPSLAASPQLASMLARQLNPFECQGNPFVESHSEHSSEPSSYSHTNHTSSTSSSPPSPASTTPGSQPVAQSASAARPLLTARDPASKAAMPLASLVWRTQHYHHMLLLLLLLLVNALHLLFEWS